MVHLYSRTDMAVARKKLRFILLDKFDFHMINNQSIAVHAFASRITMTLTQTHIDIMHIIYI